MDISCKVIDNIESCQDDQKLIIYDFSGSQIYWQSVVEATVKEIPYFVFVFDFSNKSSLDFIRSCLSKLKGNRSVKIEKALILGNKCDLVNRAVHKEDVERLAKETGIPVREVSIKDFEGVNSSFGEFLKIR